MIREPAAFLAIAALVIATPGQDTVLTIRNTLLGGRVHVIATALAVCCGQASHRSANNSRPRRS